MDNSHTAAPTAAQRAQANVETGQPQKSPRQRRKSRPPAPEREKTVAGQAGMRTAQEAVAAGEERFRGIFEQGSFGIALLDLDHRFVQANPAFCRMLCYEEHELIGMTMADITAPEDVSRSTEGTQALFAGTLPFLTMDKRYLRKDGNPIWGHVSAAVMHDAAGNPVGSISMIDDIGELKKTEGALRLTQLSVDRAADLIHWVDPAGRLLYVSDSTCRRHGYSREEMLGLTVFDLDPLQSPDMWKEHWKEIKARGSLTFESQHRTKEGEVFPLELTANYVECDGREYNFAFGRDLTERKRQEEERRQLIDGMNDTAYVISFSGKFLEVNDRAIETLGYSRIELLGMGPSDIDPCLGPTDVGKLIEGMKRGERQVFETWHKAKDGRTIPVEISSSPVSYRGEPAILSIARDLTDRQQAAEALAAEKERLCLLNAAAVEMSHCLTTAEVQRAGIRLACETGNCDGGVMWVLPSSGRSRIIGSEGLSREGRAQLTRILRTSAALEEATSRLRSVQLEGAEELKDEGSDEDVFAGALLVPVSSRGKVLGVLCLATRPGHPVATRADIALAEGIAALIGVALENAYLYEHARFLAQRDPVTGLVNHRGIAAQLEKELARSERQGGCFTVVMMDLDNFKLFNDTYGHVCGDKVLQHVSTVLSRSVRRGDTVGRYGGDEFVALLPDTDAAGATKTIERIQRTLGELGYSTDGVSRVPVFMSYGVATYPFDGRCVSELLALADTNLYRSKRQGGNCVTASRSEGERHDLEVGLFSVLDGLVTAVDGKDRYTRKHSDDVCELAVAVASELGLSTETQRCLRIAALLHDVGKIGIPDHILRKPGVLTEEEREAIKQHVNLGELITKEIPNLAGVLDAVSTHHERYDGQGYPRQLAGTEIPLLGRILAATDAYSAMTTDRPYRKALTLEEAESELRRVSGSQLDPRVVRAFLAVLTRASYSESSVGGPSTSAA